MFLQIHSLTSYPLSLLNRDDAGLAKRAPFGNAVRLRVSSQCLKRHWREDLTNHLPQEPDGFRSRSFFSRYVRPEAVKQGVPDELAGRLLDVLKDKVMQGSEKEGAEERKEDLLRREIDLKQPVLFGKPEGDYFVQLLVQASQNPDPTQWLKNRLDSKEERENLAAMKKAAGLTGALFGRMVTSDLLARVDAPVHVAHAFTVHAANTEMDYFTVVDDLNREEETGAAHANETELGAGVYYGYVAVDIPLLVANLLGCDPKQWQEQDPTSVKPVLKALVRSVATQSPGAKKGSTAPYAWADFVLLETGRDQPRTLANAFLEALPTRGDVRQQAVNRLCQYMDQLDAMYGNGLQRFFSSTLQLPSSRTSQPLEAVIDQALQAIFEKGGA